jgi:hypothetical protein
LRCDTINVTSTSLDVNQNLVSNRCVVVSL